MPFPGPGFLCSNSAGYMGKGWQDAEQGSALSRSGAIKQNCYWPGASRGRYQVPDSCTGTASIKQHASPITLQAARWVMRGVTWRIGLVSWPLDSQPVRSDAVRFCGALGKKAAGHHLCTGKRGRGLLGPWMLGRMKGWRPGSPSDDRRRPVPGGGLREGARRYAKRRLGL